jgi:very-short-patch-repair endonuclease
MINKKSQKKYFYDALVEIFGQQNIEKEVTFDWMKPADNFEKTDEFKEIIQNLQKYRNKSEFIKNFKPKCDYVIKKHHLIIEYDEKQHFTVPRKISLESYSTSIKTYYDKDCWIKSCEVINAKDNDPHYRDEQRALYDSIRDIQSFLNGYKLLRIKECDYDWSNKNSIDNLKEILKTWSIKLVE